MVWKTYGVSERQSLVLANNEEEAKVVSNYEREHITHTLKWDGRWRFWNGSSDQTIGDYISILKNNGKLRPHIINDDMFCDLNVLLSAKKSKKRNVADNITLEEAFKEIRGIIKDDGFSNVPNEIKDAIRKAAEYRAKASTYEIVIEKWFDTIGVSDDDGFRDTYIDCVQQSNNPEEAIRWFESNIGIN